MECGDKMKLLKNVKWIITVVFILITIGTVVIFVNHNRLNANTNLSNFKIDKFKIGSKMNKHKFELDDDVLLKKVYVYSMVDHPEFIVLVNKRSNQIVGMSLLNDDSLQTNYGWKIGDDISKVKASLNANYREKSLHNGFKSLIFIDKKHKIKLFVVHKNNKIKKIEIHNK